MRAYQVALLPGDGIGHEVCPEGVKVIAAVGELLGNFRITYETFPWGCEYYLQPRRDDGEGCAAHPGAL